MKRRERTRVLVEGDPEIARRIASEVEQATNVDVIDAPREELVMVKVRESARRSQFYVGEALMTTCRVKVCGTQGFGMLLGSSRDAAYALAVADAAFECGGDSFDIAGWDALLCAEACRLDAEAAASRRAVEATKVDFSTMEVEL